MLPDDGVEGLKLIKQVRHATSPGHQYEMVTANVIFQKSTIGQCKVAFSRCVGCILG